MNQTISIFNALADEHRVRMLLALRDGELCVCQLAEFSNLAQSTVSKHMSILKQAGLVEGRKSGRWVYYRLPGTGGPSGTREMIDWVLKSLETDPKVIEDRIQVERIRSTHLEEVCPDRSHVVIEKVGSAEAIDR
ncbi:MAG: metalloregulator ArsR/SmtB family transcription factor [bacterium]